MKFIILEWRQQKSSVYKHNLIAEETKQFKSKHELKKNYYEMSQLKC